MNRNTIPLPPNATRLERAYVESGAATLALDIPVDRVWDAWRCPAPMLPMLAYALSVDLWDDSWDEVRQRQTIAESPDYHRRKGTRGAIERAIAYVRRTATVLEWHEYTTPRRRGTFDVLVHLEGGVAQAEASLDADVRALILRLVRSAKAKSRAFALLEAHVQAGVASVGIGISSPDTISLGVPPDDLKIEFTPRVLVDVAGFISLGVQ